jgi:hypothetical protein
MASPGSGPQTRDPCPTRVSLSRPTGAFFTLSSQIVR